MNKKYFSFSWLRYVEKQGVTSKVTVEKIQSIIGCRFEEVNVTSGLAEKRYEAKVFGCDIRLEHWRFQDHIIYTLSGRSIIYHNWGKEDVVKLNDYFISLFSYYEMPGWYMRTSEETLRDEGLAGGEAVS